MILKSNPVIYAIRNTINNRAYVGRSSFGAQRRSQHKNTLRAGKHTNKNLQLEWNEHGEDCFIWEDLEFLETVDGIENREQFYIDAENNPYNIGRAEMGLKAGGRHANCPRSDALDRIRAVIRYALVWPVFPPSRYIARALGFNEASLRINLLPWMRNGWDGQAQVIRWTGKGYELTEAAAELAGKDETG